MSDISTMAIKAAVETDQIKSGLDNATRMIEAFDKKLANVGNKKPAVGVSGDGVMGGMFKSMALGLSSLQALAMEGIKYTVRMAADAEQIAMSLSVILKSADRANVLIADVRKFAVQTPFTSTELLKGTQQLIAYGFAARDIIPTLKALGDVKSAFPTSQLEDFIRIFGQIKTMGVAHELQIKELAIRGVPIYEELGKVLNVDQAAVRELVEEGKVGFKELTAVFNNLTQKGGMFENMMGKQSETLSGKWSTFIDNLEIVAIDIGNVVVEALDLKGSLDSLIEASHTSGSTFNILKSILSTVWDVVKNGVHAVVWIWDVLKGFAMYLADTWVGQIIGFVGGAIGHLWQDIKGLLGELGTAKEFMNGVAYAISYAWGFVQDVFTYFADVTLSRVAQAFLWLGEKAMGVLIPIVSVLEAIDDIQPFDTGITGATDKIRHFKDEVKKQKESFRDTATNFQWGDNMRRVDDTFKEVRNTINNTTDAVKDFNKAMSTPIVPLGGSVELKKHLKELNKDTINEFRENRAKLISGYMQNKDPYQMIPDMEFRGNHMKLYREWEGLNKMGLGGDSHEYMTGGIYNALPKGKQEELRTKYDRQRENGETKDAWVQWLMKEMGVIKPYFEMFSKDMVAIGKLNPKQQNEILLGDATLFKELIKSAKIDSKLELPTPSLERSVDAVSAVNRYMAGNVEVNYQQMAVEVLNRLLRTQEENLIQAKKIHEALKDNKELSIKLP